MGTRHSVPCQIGVVETLPRTAPNGSDRRLDMGVNPPPSALLLPREPQPHQVFHQHSNVELQWDICMEPSLWDNVCCTPCCVRPVTRHLKIFQIRWKKVNLPRSIGHK